MGWVSSQDGETMITEFWCGNVFWNGCLEDWEANGRIILWCILEK